MQSLANVHTIMLQPIPKPCHHVPKSTRACYRRSGEAALRLPSLQPFSLAPPLLPSATRSARIRDAAPSRTGLSRSTPGPTAIPLDTKRDYWVYVPAQYNADRPACVMVFQDGREWIDEKGRWRILVVFDNLIAQKAMPPTIGIFIDPGSLTAKGPNKPGDANREIRV